MMEKWQWEWLIRVGLVRSDGIGRKAKLRKCPLGCGDHTLLGLDGQVCAVVVSVQPGPISREIELAALIQGRRTFNLLPIQNSKTYPAFELVPRTPPLIRRNSVWDVLAEHRCGNPLPTIESRLYRELPEDPPF